jgi:hypothetical protein
LGGAVDDGEAAIGSLDENPSAYVKFLPVADGSVSASVR